MTRTAGCERAVYGWVADAALKRLLSRSIPLQLLPGPLQLLLLLRQLLTQVRGVLGCLASNGDYMSIACLSSIP